MTSVPPFYRGRKRGEVVRTRTVISQAHSSQWLGSFGNRGNGLYRTELRLALSVATRLSTSSRKSAPCCGSTGNMAPGPC